MGYLIDNGFIKKEIFYIRSNIAQNMDATTPYLLKTISGKYYIPIAANVTLDSVTYITPYNGFTHLHLGLNDVIFTAAGGIIATIASNALNGGDIARNHNYQFIINLQSAPTRFGSSTPENNNLYIWWDNLPTVGDADMILTVYYVQQDFT